MSLFDSIRYPVSDNPTREELNAIPKEILRKWREKQPKDLLRSSKSFEKMLSELRHEILIHNETKQEKFARYVHNIRKWFRL